MVAVVRVAIRRMDVDVSHEVLQVPVAIGRRERHQHRAVAFGDEARRVGADARPELFSGSSLDGFCAADRRSRAKTRRRSGARNRGETGRYISGRLPDPAQCQLQLRRVARRRGCLDECEGPVGPVWRRVPGNQQAGQRIPLRLRLEQREQLRRCIQPALRRCLKDTRRVARLGGVRPAQQLERRNERWNLRRRHCGRSPDRERQPAIECYRVAVLALVPLEARIAQQIDELPRSPHQLSAIGHRRDDVKDDLLNGIAGGHRCGRVHSSTSRPCAAARSGRMR